MTEDDIEAAAKAAFYWFHGQAHRPRNWGNHPDYDSDVENGRDTFRGMARAALGAVERIEVDLEPAEVARLAEMRAAMKPTKRKR